MTPEQIMQLLKLLERIAESLSNRPFTITQATDWAMLAILGGVFLTLAGIAVGFFWKDVGRRFENVGNGFEKGIGDIKQMLKEFRAEDIKSHDNLKTDFEKADNVIWQAMKDCQGDCCPPRRRKED